MKIQDVYYNNTNGEISIWISYNGEGTDTNLATLEADFLVAGYSNGKLIRAASKKDFEMKKRTAASETSKNSVQIGFDLANVNEIRIFLFEAGGLKPLSLSKEIKIEDLVRLNGAKDSELTPGQLAAVKRADQLTGFKFTPVTDGMDSALAKTSAYTTFEKGKEYQGIPYSSCESNDKFICENVSFETLLTALANPDSVLYTKDIKDASNGSTYYGMVCNSLVRYSYGIELRCNTANWKDLPGISQIGETKNLTVNDARIADSLWRSGHVAMITDILKDDNGKVVAIEVSEAVRQTAKRRVYKAEDVFSNYTILYRYDNLKSVPPFDEQQDAILKSGLDKIAPVIAVDHGNKSNYLKGETVVISSFKEGENTVVIEKEDGEVIETIPVNGYTKINKTGLEAGYYKVKLQGTSYENEFCVCDPGMITVERTTSNKMKFVLDRTGIGKDMEICFADFRNGNGLVTNGMMDLSANKSADSFQIKLPTSAYYYKLYLRNRYGIWTHKKTTIPALAS